MSGTVELLGCNDLSPSASVHGDTQQSIVASRNSSHSCWPCFPPAVLCGDQSVLNNDPAEYAAVAASTVTLVLFFSRLFGSCTKPLITGNCLTIVIVSKLILDLLNMFEYILSWQEYS